MCCPFIGFRNGFVELHPQEVGRGRKGLKPQQHTLRDKTANPIYMIAMDGFGNLDPGSGHYEQAKSDWDVIHPGWAWAEKCNGAHAEENVILSKIKKHLKNIERKP